MPEQFVPWNSLAESLVDTGERRLIVPEGLAEFFDIDADGRIEAGWRTDTPAA